MQDRANTRGSLVTSQGQDATERRGDADRLAGVHPDWVLVAQLGQSDPVAPNDDAEFQALHVPVIALENLVIALLAAGSDQDRALAGEMASDISPRPGFTRHPLTIHAAAHISDLVERAVRFRSPRPA